MKDRFDFISEADQTFSSLMNFQVGPNRFATLLFNNLLY